MVAANQQKYRYNTYGTLTPGYFIPFWGIWKLRPVRLRVGILYRYLHETPTYPVAPSSPPNSHYKHQATT